MPITDDNPYKSPLATRGSSDRPSWAWILDSPGWLAIALACFMFAVVLIGAIGGAILAAPANRYQSVGFGCVYAVWGAVWAIAGRAWWKNTLATYLAWTLLGIAPLALIVAGLI